MFDTVLDMSLVYGPDKIPFSYKFVHNPDSNAWIRNFPVPLFYVLISTQKKWKTRKTGVWLA